ncbi:hypothetical protein MML48_scaffold00001321 [Holotrichia oblita]|nr:hypothetical protein MML48_scaffold00001321 [Holotrichia oblita]
MRPRNRAQKSKLKFAASAIRFLPANKKSLTRQVVLKSSTSDILNNNDEIADKFDAVTPKNYPIAYVSKKWFFYGLPFFVDQSVLVPRFDTEVLVSEAIKLTGVQSGLKVLDLCTGSGCIAVAVAKNTDANVYASDISKEALAIAKKNAEQNKVRVKFIKSDLFESIDDSFDIIVSNPPYIKTAEIGKYDKSTLCEPRHALDGGTDGLDFYRKIAAGAHTKTKYLILEIGHDQSKGVTKILQDSGFYDIKVVKDKGEQDREIERHMADGDYLTHAKEHKKLTPIIEAYDKFISYQSDYKAALELDMQDEAEKAKEQIERSRDELKILMLPKDERDDSNVIMEIRPAAGGDEAALFAAALLRMYTMYAAANGFKTEINDISETEIGGIKEVSFNINGDNAFSRFKYESGVHRVQRVPDTETQGRIHTSTCTVAVLPEAVTVDFKIDEKDLKIDTYRASGAGGQHVNRTESAIRITHLPTNTVVTCQDGRSQLKNREKAMVILQTKLADFYQSQADAQYAQTRKTQVGTGDRSERIRTYNYPQGRITDHRISFTVYNLLAFMNGDIGDLMEALRTADIQSKLSGNNE